MIKMALGDGVSIQIMRNYFDKLVDIGGIVWVGNVQLFWVLCVHQYDIVIRSVGISGTKDLL
jgi:hypothetical protein